MLIHRHNPPRPPRKAPPKEPKEPKEIGHEKDARQHVGNAAFGLASFLGTVGNMRRVANLAGSTPISALIPGINLVAAGVEGTNAFRKYRAGEKVVAATAAGNAVGCLATFMEESSLLALRLQRTGLSSALAASGGVLGLIAGTIEFRQGLALKRQTGSSRTLAMGTLDLTSGAVSLAGAAMLKWGAHPKVGTTMLIGSGLIDMAGIGVDYLWPTPKKEAPKPP